MKDTLCSERVARTTSPSLGWTWEQQQYLLRPTSSPSSTSCHRSLPYRFLYASSIVLLYYCYLPGIIRFFHDATWKSPDPRTSGAKEMATAMTPRRRRPAGQAFYTTALVVTLFAVYSVLRDVGDSKQAVRYSSRLALRSLEKRDQEVCLPEPPRPMQVLTH